MVIKKFNRSESAQKNHASRDQYQVRAHQFWWVWSLRFQRNQLKKFMQVGIDVKCMHTDFGGYDLSGFGDMATLQKRPNFPFGAWTIVHGH